MRNAVGFYWTLPVPWAGFKSLPDDIDAAAKVSRTIRYQCETIRRHARRENYCLIHEEVYLEINPDRGGDEIRASLTRIANVCRKQNACLLYVDFSLVQGWRSHSAMSDWAKNANIALEPLFPDQILMEGQTFDPTSHFSQWRERQSNWIQKKPERHRIAKRRIADMVAQGTSFKEIAQHLNAANIQSLTGKPWSAEMARKIQRAP
ncbi:MAG: hypothetical protein COC12_01625 [Rhodobacteraceae bacterium]|nr:MAG: hypothetical protein COC12_01625 [Paracoccaceae bacterium]